MLKVKTKHTTPEQRQKVKAATEKYFKDHQDLFVVHKIIEMSAATEDAKKGISPEHIAIMDIYQFLVETFAEYIAFRKKDAFWLDRMLNNTDLFNDCILNAIIRWIS